VGDLWSRLLRYSVVSSRHLFRESPIEIDVKGDVIVVSSTHVLGQL